MPVYEYTCKDCGQHLEVAQSFKDEPLTTCPNCGGPLRKVFGSIGIMFKGSGFYRTDSRVPSGKKPSKDKAEVGASTSGDGASGSSSGEGGKTASEGSGSSDKAASPAGDGPGTSSKSGAKSADKSTAKTA